MAATDPNTIFANEPSWGEPILVDANGVNGVKIDAALTNAKNTGTPTWLQLQAGYKASAGFTVDTGAIVKITGGSDDNGDWILDSNQKGILFSVKGRLYLEDIHLKVGGKNGSTDLDGFEIDTGGALKISGDTIIEDNNAQPDKTMLYIKGGSVLMAGGILYGSSFDHSIFVASSGAFRMTGGEITGLKLNGSASNLNIAIDCSNGSVWLKNGSIHDLPSGKTYVQIEAGNTLEVEDFEVYGTKTADAVLSGNAFSIDKTAVVTFMKNVKIYGFAGGGSHGILGLPTTELINCEVYGFQKDSYPININGSNATITVSGGSYHDNNITVNGGVFNINPGSLIINDDAQFYNNQTTVLGGVIYNVSATAGTGGTTTINSGTFTNNHSTGSSGNGGVIYTTASKLEINGGVFGITAPDGSDIGKGNSAVQLGGVIFSQKCPVMITSDSVEMAGNHGNGSGGAIYADADLTINGGIFHDNSTAAFGGAIFINSGKFTMTNGEVYNNTSKANGGGIAINNGTPIINGGSIHDNTAEDSGGGVYSAKALAMTGGYIYMNDAVTDEQVSTTPAFVIPTATPTLYVQKALQSVANDAATLTKEIHGNVSTIGKGGSFRFMMYDMDGTAIYHDPADSDGEGYFSFPQDGAAIPGANAVALYQIKQLPPTEDNWNFGAGVYTIAVSYTPASDDGLTPDVYNVSYLDGPITYANVFTNNVYVSGRTDIIGAVPVEEAYTFTLYKKEDTAFANAIASAKNEADGTFAIGPIPLQQYGAYEYVVKQTTSDSVNFPIDSVSATRDVKIVLQESWKGDLTDNPVQVPTIIFDFGEQGYPVFNNSVSNKTGGLALFGGVDVTEKGKYDFTIESTDVDGQGWQYDHTQINVLVDVDDDVQGNLFVRSVTFPGGYLPILSELYVRQAFKLLLKAMIQVTGARTNADLKGGEFAVGVFREDKSPASISYNDPTGDVSFAPILFYDMDKDGKTWYLQEISESSSVVTGDADHGWTIDPGKVLIKLEFDEETNLVNWTVEEGGTKTIGSGEAEETLPLFTNTYAVRPAAIRLSAKVVVTGFSQFPDGKFKFKVVDNTSGNIVARGTNTQFGNIVFSTNFDGSTVFSDLPDDHTASPVPVVAS